MKTDDLTQAIKSTFPDAQINIKTDDNVHFFVTIISDCFAEQPLLQRQRRIYACVDHHITTGELHALSLKTYTTTEWEKQKSTI